jgi:hypothetical protein
MNVADLFVPSTLLNQPVVYCWIYNCECKKRVCFGWYPYCKWTHQIHKNHDLGVRCQILLIWAGAAHISCIFSAFMSFDMLEKWNINYQCSKSCVRPGHVIVFLIVVSVLVCHGRSKYSCNQESTLCLLSQSLRNSQGGRSEARSFREWKLKHRKCALWVWTRLPNLYTAWMGPLVRVTYMRSNSECV